MGPFNPHGAPFTSDHQWLEEWALGASSPGSGHSDSDRRLVHVVHGSYVNFQTLGDVGAGGVTASGLKEAPYPQLSEVLIGV